MKKALSVDKTTIARQRLASDPNVSAWVGANAGSGKTFVLARRVIRLLLSGVDPSKILCLTFTKAAAAEMSERVFAALAEWVIAEEEDLRDELQELINGPVKRSHIESARQLFAKALETPGGLKIQTIHAFCERLLHQFPVEANVAGHFEVLDDHGRANLIAEAEREMLIDVHQKPDSLLAKSLATIITTTSDSGYRDALHAYLFQCSEIERWIDEAGGLMPAIGSLYEKFGLIEGENLASVNQQMAEMPDFTLEALGDLANELKNSSSRYQAQGELLHAFLIAESEDEKRQLAINLLLTKALTPKTEAFLAPKALWESRPDLTACLQKAQARLVDLMEKRKAVQTIEATSAILTLGSNITNAYRSKKQQRGLMDFDDLIDKAAALLEVPEAAAWVHFKLDQGLDHILVDEAQDTSPRQWDIVAHLADEFFTGESARKINRTIFAVGDEKQSIYSFQGASPEWFSAMRDRFSKAAADAEARFDAVPLALSFRSTSDVLDAVDLVFDQDEMRDKLTDAEYYPHQAARQKQPGFVELWPPFQKPEASEHQGEWWQPLDELGENSAEAKLAKTLADYVSALLARNEQLSGASRPLSPGDILILSKKRGPIVDAISRALKSKGVSVAGSDRLKLADSIIVQDLLALVDFALLSEDDLALAGLLKSPLIGFSEEELFELSHGRTGTLWRALSERAKESKEPFVGAYERLFRWRSEADYTPPFDFFMKVLARDHGRSSFLQRLGSEVDEILEAFLIEVQRFEQSEIPTLQGFVSWFRSGSVEIKRDMEGVNDEVRIMTVHGSKGLEAPIVFLVDSGQPVHSAHLPDLLNVGSKAAPAFIWRQGRDGVTERQKKAAEDEKTHAISEYYRLLYVAMTRAEDRLYLLNIANAKGEPQKGGWFDVVFNALSTSDDWHETRNDEDEILFWRWYKEEPEVVTQTSQQHITNQSDELPHWIDQPVKPASQTVIHLSPSKSETVDYDGDHPSTNWLQEDDVLHEIDPRLRGTLMHRLFERLPAVPVEERGAIALTFLKAELSDVLPEKLQEMVEEVIRILASEELSHLFKNDGNARAEVPISGALTLGGVSYQVQGEIDRLIVQNGIVHIVDFKTNRAVPKELDQVPALYRRQLAIYRKVLEPLFPDFEFKTSLLWTKTASLMTLPEAMLNQALKL